MSTCKPFRLFLNSTQLSSAIVENDGSLSRSLFKLAQSTSRGTPSAVVPQTENVSALKLHALVMRVMVFDVLQACCPLCLEDAETLLHAPCSHGYCRMCWEGLLSVALQDTSTTKVKTGAQDLLDVSKLQCPGCSCVPRALSFVSCVTHFVLRSYTANHMDKFISLSFIQAVVPSTTNQIAQCICKVNLENLRSLAQLTLILSNPLSSISTLPPTSDVQDLASKYIRAALPAAQCKCGAVVVGSVQEDEFTCVCGNAGSIGQMKRSSDSQWMPHPFASCSACHTWSLLGTSGSIERCASHLSRSFDVLGRRH
jgi:hypothetical protein